MVNPVELPAGVKVIWPPLRLEVTPAAASIVDNRLPTLSPMPIEVPELELVAANEKVTPLTTSESAVVSEVDRSFEVEPAVPDSSVAVVIAAAVVVLSLLTAVPVVGPVAKFNRFVEVAPVATVEVTMDLVE